MPEGRGRISIYWALFVTLLVPASSGAQNGGSSAGDSDQATIAQLMEQIKQLQQQDRELLERIKVLEAKQPQTVPATEADAAAPVTPPNPAEETPAPQPPPAAPPDWREIHNIRWHGFGEVDYKVLNQRMPELGTYGFVPGSAGNFYTGDFGLFLSPRLTAKTNVLAEVVFEERDAQRYEVDLRRLLLKYDHNDRLKISIGRYQTDIGYYNWAFQSAAWLQTTADRPLVMEYASNGGLLPTQAIGISVTGEIPSGKMGLNYVAEYGSSDTIRPDLNGDGLVTDENNGNHINFGFFLRPEAIPGLQLGASYYHDQVSNNVLDAPSEVQIPTPLGPSARYNQTIVNDYVVYTAHGIEFLNEGFLLRQALIGGALRFDMPAFYSQLSRQFGHVRPFFRYQYVNANTNSNSIFNEVGLRFGPSFGVRYDLNDYIAFKAQLDRTARGGLPDLDGLQLQWAFTF